MRLWYFLKNMDLEKSLSVCDEKGIDYEDASDLVQKFIIDKLYMKSDSIKNIEFARTWMYQRF